MNIYIYIAAMAVTTYLIRILPMTLFRKPIRSRFLRSFLHYVPFACLTSMAFPSVLTSAGSLAAALCALAVAVTLSWLGKGAQPTDTVRSLLRQHGILAKFAEAKK